ncbi:MAG: glycosyltransferase family 4 protein [Chloroflexota bacterium]
MVLTVGFDATSARQGAGIGRYTRQLLSALAERDDDIDFRLFSAGGLAFLHLNGRFRSRPLPISDRVLNLLWHRWRLPLPVQMATGRFDIFHSPDFTLPPVRGRPSVLTIHDLAFLRRPECAYPTLRAYLQTVVPRSVRRADHLIAVSENTKRDLIELLDVPDKKITAIPLGVAEPFRLMEQYEATPLLKGIGVEEPYILSVGTIEPRKNYPALLDAFALLRERGLRCPLIIAGRFGWMFEGVRQRLAGLPEGAVRIVEPDDAALAALYARSAAFVYPSLYEGFGVPVLEAMACGAPVITSRTSSLPEVAGDAAIVIDPENVEDIAAAIDRVLGSADVAERLRKAGPERAMRFRWERTAAETVAVYRSLALHA